MITKINQPLKQKPQFYLTMYNCQDRGLNVERCTWIAHKLTNVKHCKHLIRHFYYI